MGNRPRVCSRWSKQAEGGWRLEARDVGIGSVHAKGTLALDAANLASGRVTLAAADLDDLSALALQKSSGRLEADLSLDVKDGRQGLSLDAKRIGIKRGVRGDRPARSQGPNRRCTRKADRQCGYRHRPRIARRRGVFQNSSRCEGKSGRQQVTLECRCARLQSVRRRPARAGRALAARSLGLRGEARQEADRARGAGLRSRSPKAGPRSAISRFVADGGRIAVARPRRCDARARPRHQGLAVIGRPRWRCRTSAFPGRSMAKRGSPDQRNRRLAIGGSSSPGSSRRRRDRRGLPALDVQLSGQARRGTHNLSGSISAQKAGSSGSPVRSRLIQTGRSISPRRVSSMPELANTALAVRRAAADGPARGSTPQCAATAVAPLASASRR